MAVPDPERDAQFYRGVPLRRLVAFLIDTLVIFGFWFALVIVAVVVTLGAALPIALLLLTLTGIGYRWLMLARRSATLGMLATGIEVRGPDGERCNSTLALLHTLAFSVTLFFPPLLLIGWILMATSDYRRALHDLILGTVVINRPV